MEDKTIMDNILSATKGVCDLMMHGAIESSTKEVHDTFAGEFTKALAMQNAIYTKMASKGWYPTQQAEQQKIDNVKQKFSAQ